MTIFNFSTKDIKQIEAKGLSVEKVLEQIEIFKNNSKYVKLNRPCIIDDGIKEFSEDEIQKLYNEHSKELRERATKFLPASGAATRMFKLLQEFEEHEENERNDFIKFIENLKDFAFYEDLKLALEKDGFDIEKLILEENYIKIIDYLLLPKGLNYLFVPKALIKFHKYSNYIRTALEEHLVETVNYVRDKEHNVNIHLTISPEHEKIITELFENIREKYENELNVKFNATFSFQKESTDTIAVDINNNPFRDREKKLFFRPSGHGALIENLNDLKADIVFMKNIDNVLPDHLKPETFKYKTLLGCYLIKTQNKIFEYLKAITDNNITDNLIDEILSFLQKELSVQIADSIKSLSKESKKDFIFNKLNRPLRVCGMVKNQGEQGGGPFWIESKDGVISLQIIETSQINKKDEKQKEILSNATHFNPVDLVCGLKDFKGNSFNILNYIDKDMIFISVKSRFGEDVKSLETGLWNGGMADWNTIFIEVPIITFNPVKTLMDLLKKEHQPLK